MTSDPRVHTQPNWRLSGARFSSFNSHLSRFCCLYQIVVNSHCGAGFSSLTPVHPNFAVYICVGHDAT